MQEWDEFEWDDDNEEHLAEHGVDRYEAEEAATDPAAIVKRVGTDRYGNRRYISVGKTEGRRILFMMVDRKGQRRWRIGSARDAKFKVSALYIFGNATGHRVADRIAAALEEEPDGLTRTDLVNLFKRNVSRDRIDQALALLEGLGRVRRVVVETGGRPAEKWLLA